MLGHSHALSGATAFAALCSLTPALGVHPHWGAVTAGLLASTGAALLPDLDHPQATIAWTFGPITRALAVLINRASGGHRHATHSLAFAAAVPLMTWAGDTAFGRPFEAAALFMLFAFGIRALRFMPGLVAVSALGAVTLAWFLLLNLSWLPWAVAAGVVAHLAGDCLTKEGCPLLWPHRRHYMVPIIQRTGNRVETLLFAPVFGIGTVALLVFAR